MRFPSTCRAIGDLGIFRIHQSSLSLRVIYFTNSRHGLQYVSDLDIIVDITSFLTGSMRVTPRSYFTSFEAEQHRLPIPSASLLNTSRCKISSVVKMSYFTSIVLERSCPYSSLLGMSRVYDRLWWGLRGPFIEGCRPKTSFGLRSLVPTSCGFCSCSPSSLQIRYCNSLEDYVVAWCKRHEA